MNLEMDRKPDTSQEPRNFSRRDFFKILGGTSAGVAASSVNVGGLDLEQASRFLEQFSPRVKSVLGLQIPIENPLGRVYDTTKFYVPFSARPLEAAPEADAIVEGGRFYWETNAGASRDLGYLVQGQMYSVYERLGGPSVWGYPVSKAYYDKIGRLSQVMQRGEFQINPDGKLEFRNIFDELSAAGKDDWLISVRQTPKSQDWSVDTGKPWGEVVRNHLAILDKNPAIKAVYTRNPLWLEMYGLPMGIGDFGNQVTIRCQRAAFQQWKENVPWARAGEVTIALGGDIAKEAGLIPYSALQLETIYANNPATPTPETGGSFPREIGDLGRDGVAIHNKGTRIGVVDNKDPQNNWQAVVNVARQYAPGDRFEFFFYDNPNNVPAPSGPVSYDTNINWPNSYPGAEWGKQLRVQVNGVWQWHVSIPSNLRPEDVGKFSSNITTSVLRFFISKDNVRTTWGSDFAAILRQQGSNFSNTSLKVILA